MRNLTNSENEYTIGRNLSNTNGEILTYTLSASLPVVYTENTDEASVISLKGLSTIGSENQIMKVNGSGNLEWVADTDTTYTATEPLDITGTTISLKGLSGYTANKILKVNSAGDAIEYADDNNTEYTATLPISINPSNVISTAFTTSSSDIMSNKTIYNPILTGASGANPKFQIKDESLTHTINVFTQEIGADINISFPASTGSLALVDDVPTTAEIRALLSADTPLVYDNSTGNFTTTFTPSSTTTLTNKSGSNNMWTNDAGYRTQANVIQDIGEATNVANTTIIGATPTRFVGNGHCDLTLKGATTTIESDNLVIDSKIKGILKLTNGATSAGAIQIFEDEDAGSNAITIQPHAQTYADFTITLPSSAGQLALTTDFTGFITSDSVSNLSNKTFIDSLIVSPTNTTSFYIAKLLAADIGDGNSIEMILGQANTANNCATFSYYHSADDATANYLILGMKGNENMIRLYANDTIEFNANISSTIQVFPTNTTSFYIMKLLAASLSDSNMVEMVIGKANSAKNCGAIAYQHSSDGADANYMQIGMKSQETQIKLLGDGKIEFNTDQITHDAGTATAMNYISSDGASAISIISAGVDSGVKQVATLIMRSVGTTTSTATIEFNGSSERLTINNIDGEAWFGGDDATQIKCKTDEVNCSCNKFFCADLRLGVQEVGGYTYHFNPSGTNGAATNLGMFLAYHDNASVLYFGTPYNAAVVGNKDFYYGNVIKQRMMANGTCYSTGLWTDSHSFSDDRLKEEETELTNCMETINKLKPQIYKKFTLNSLGEENPLEPNIYIPFTERLSDEYKWETGFIAQEIYTIPELRHIVELPPDSDIDKVLNTKLYDGLNESKGFYEAQGWGNKQPASIDSPQIIPYLVGALQDMDKQIKQQQVIIDKLISSKSFKEFKS